MVIILEMDVVKSAKDIGGKIGVPTPYLGGKIRSTFTAIKKYRK